MKLLNYQEMSDWNELSSIAGKWKFCRIYWQWILIEQTSLYTVVYRTFLYNPTNLKFPNQAPCRTLAEGVNAVFTVMPRSLICSHFCSDLPAASSDRVIRKLGVPPIDRWWLLLAFNWRPHLWDQLNACRIDARSSCCWILGAMSLTSSAKSKWLHVSSSAKSLINIRKRRGRST